MKNQAIENDEAMEIVPVEENTELRDRVKDLRHRVDEDYWKLSEALYEVYEGSHYVGWGFKTWKEYVEGELDFQLRKAQYFVAIQEWFGSMKPSIQKWVRGLGWTKAKELVGVVTPENASQWRKNIDGLTFKQLQDMIRENREEATGEEKGESKSAKDEKPARKSFSLFADQMTNVDGAIKLAMEIANTDKEGHALDMICLDFLATNGSSPDIASMLSRIEKTTGLKFVAVDPEQDAIVYGEDLLEQLDKLATEE